MYKSQDACSRVSLANVSQIDTSGKGFQNEITVSRIHFLLSQIMIDILASGKIKHELLLFACSKY